MFVISHTYHQKFAVASTQLTMAASAPVVRAFGAPLRRVRLPLGMKPLEAVTSDTATIDALVGETQVGDTMKRVWRPPAETAIKVLQRVCAPTTNDCHPPDTLVTGLPIMQAVVVYAHGLNEHSGRFSRFAAELVAHGFGVTSCDAPGLCVVRNSVSHRQVHGALTPRPQRFIQVTGWLQQIQASTDSSQMLRRWPKCLLVSARVTHPVVSVHDRQVTHTPTFQHRVCTGEQSDIRGAAAVLLGLQLWWHDDTSSALGLTPCASGWSGTACAPRPCVAPHTTQCICDGVWQGTTPPPCCCCCCSKGAFILNQRLPRV